MTRVLLGLYVGHLVLPGLLVLDVLLAWPLGLVGRSGKLVAVVCVSWIVATTAPLLLTRDRPRFLRRCFTLIISAYIVYAWIVVLELVAPIAVSRAHGPILRNAGARYVAEPDAAAMPGVVGPATFTVNELGLRGASLPARDDLYRIIAVGGSTTESLYLDDSEEWSQLLMKRLNDGQRKPSVWIANAGMSGHNTAHHLVLLRSLPVLATADLLVFLIGANDLQASLAFDGAPAQAAVEQEAASFHDRLSGHNQSPRPFFRRSELYQLSWKTGLRLFAGASFRLEQTVAARHFGELRRRRQAAPVVSLPDLHVGLGEYLDRVQMIARECRALRRRCLFVTQPSLWRSDLTPMEQSLLWFGWVGRWGTTKGYVTPGDGAAALAMYNRALLDQCRQHMLECYDLAAVIPKDTRAFYDDFHFNENGARLVADALDGYLRATPPFATR